MKRFACGDVVPGCDKSWTCETEDEILGNVAQHARVDHGLQDIPAELVEQVRAKISTLA